MKCIKSYTTLILLILIFIISMGGLPSYAENIDPDNDGSQYAWGENVGWINFQPSFGSGVTVTDSAVTGYSWGENIGWINLSPTNGGVVNDGAGNLSGYAWGENVGWINFAPTGGGVTIDANGYLIGRAWGENIGWITFNSASGSSPCVRTSWTPPNRPPVADNQSVLTGEDTLLSITLTGSDADGDPLSYTVLTAPANGILSGTAPNLTYPQLPTTMGPIRLPLRQLTGHTTAILQQYQ